MADTVSDNRPWGATRRVCRGTRPDRRDAARQPGRAPDELHKPLCALRDAPASAPCTPESLKSAEPSRSPSNRVATRTFTTVLQIGAQPVRAAEPVCAPEGPCHNP
jgi:hypothetical protein